MVSGSVICARAYIVARAVLTYTLWSELVKKGPLYARSYDVQCTDVAFGAISASAALAMIARSFLARVLSITFSDRTSVTKFRDDVGDIKGRGS